MLRGGDKRGGGPEHDGQHPLRHRGLHRTQQRLYRLSFSMGFSYFQAGDTAETFLRRMDEAMYQDKRSKIPERI